MDGAVFYFFCFGAFSQPQWALCPSHDLAENASDTPQPQPEPSSIFGCLSCCLCDLVISPRVEEFAITLPSSAFIPLGTGLALEAEYIYCRPEQLEGTGYHETDRAELDSRQQAPGLG